MHCVTYITGWNEYNRTLGTLNRCPYTNCTPSQLRSLKLVQHSRTKNPGIHESSYDWPAIEIDFTVPKPSFANNYGMFKDPSSSLRPSPHDFLVCLSVCISFFQNNFFLSPFPVVEAIKLTFSSDKSAIKGDPSFDQKHRLFDFANYRYSSPDSDDTRPEVCISMSYILQKNCRFLWINVCGFCWSLVPTTLHPYELSQNI